MRTILGSDETKEKQQEFMDYLLRIGDGEETTIRLSTNENTYEDVIEIKKLML